MAGRFVTVEEVVAEASSIILGVTYAEKQMMRQWAYTAQRLIGWSKADVKVSADITLSSFSAAKPSDLIRTIDLALFLSDGTELFIKYKGPGYKLPSGQDDARIHTDNRTTVQKVIVSEDNDYFNVEEFTSPDPTGAYIIVKYLGLPLDTNGLPLIPEHCKFAIMMYIRWMWAMRKGDNRLGLRESENIWLRHRATAASKGNTPDRWEAEQIAKTVNSMIQVVELRDRRF